MSDVKAIIFDLDGTLVDSHVAWLYAETGLFEKLGQRYNPEIAALYRGMNASDVAKTIHEALGHDDIRVDDAASFLKERLIEAAGEGAVKIAGADDILKWSRKSFRLAIASGSPLEVIHDIVAGFHWDDYFEAVVSSEEVANGKPHPDVFIETSRRLNLIGREILVVEDSINGIVAAQKAGMACFAVGEQDRDVKKKTADNYFSSLAEIKPAHIMEL